MINQEKLRKSGLNIVGSIPWGTHICQFYQTKEDLIDILLPYFKKGLENNEFCMWIASEPLKAEDVKKALKEANLDEYIKKGQIEILDYKEWYTKTGKFDANKVLRGWIEREKQALKKGFEGLRLTGNTFWLEKKDWKSFVDYEAAVDKVIGEYKMLAICSYSLDKCNISEIIEVVNSHQSALIRQGSEWIIVKSSKPKKLEKEMRELLNPAALLNMLEDLEESKKGIQESESNLVRAQKMAHLGNYSLNLLKDEVKWSDETFRIVGMDQAQKPLTYEQYLKIVHPEDLSLIQTTVNQSIEKKEPFDFEYRIIDTKGKTIYLHSIGQPYINESGVVEKIFGIIHDITEKKKAEKALKDSKKLIENEVKERTKELNCLYNIGKIIEKDPSLNELLVNTAKQLCSAMQFPEITKAEIIFKDKKYKCFEFKETNHFISSDIFVHGKKQGSLIVYYKENKPFQKEEQELIDGITERLGRVIERKKAQEELKNYSENLQKMVGEQTKELLESNRKQQEIAQKLKSAYGDLTEERNEVVKTKDFLRNVIDSSVNVVVSLDVKGRIIEWNKTAESITGYGSKEVKGKNLLNLSFIENKKELRTYLSNITNTSNIEVFELSLRNKNKKKKILLLSISSLKDADNKSHGLLVIGKDITSKKERHNQLSQGNSYLVKDQIIENVYETFKDKIETGFKGLCITRNNPEVIKEKYKLDIPVLWLSSHKNENFENISDLKSALNKVSDFAEKNEKSIILLERIDYLVNMYGFEETLKFIYALNDKIVVSNSILLIHINPDVLEQIQLTMVEQEIQKMPVIGEKKVELTDDLEEILTFIDMQKSMSKTVSFKDVTRRFDITKSTARRRINRLQALSLVDVKKNGRFKIISLNGKIVSG